MTMKINHRKKKQGNITLKTKMTWGSTRCDKEFIPGVQRGISIEICQNIEILLSLYLAINTEADTCVNHNANVVCTKQQWDRQMNKLDWTSLHFVEAKKLNY